MSPYLPTNVTYYISVFVSMVVLRIARSMCGRERRCARVPHVHVGNGNVLGETTRPLGHLESSRWREGPSPSPMCVPCVQGLEGVGAIGGG
eukprot:scaffold17616_cov99-Isochrysis_galbana.AAC.4